MNEKNCEHCHFVKVNELIDDQGNKSGFCYRYPPQTQMIPTQHPITYQQGLTMQTYNVSVPLTHWCGEWAPKLPVLQS